MAIKRVKNDTGATKTYVDQEVGAGSYYTIDILEEHRWIEESNTVGTTLRTDLDSGDAKMNDGTSDFTVPSEGLDFLRSMDAGCARGVLIDDSNKNQGATLGLGASGKIEYLDWESLLLLDEDGNLLYDENFNVLRGS